MLSHVNFGGKLLWDAGIILLKIDRMMDQFKIDQKFTIKEFISNSSQWPMHNHKICNYQINH